MRGQHVLRQAIDLRYGTIQLLHHRNTVRGQHVLRQAIDLRYGTKQLLHHHSTVRGQHLVSTIFHRIFYRIPESCEIAFVIEKDKWVTMFDQRYHSCITLKL